MPHSLTIDSVIKTFGSRQLLTDVFLKINTGDIIGLFGRNGTGKSVLMKILFGTMKADRKFIKLDDSKVLTTPFTHPGVIAYLPQQGYLPKYQKIDTLVRCFLSKSAITDFYREDEMAQFCKQKRVSELSGGERRYMEAKLLLFGDTKFVLLDEPFDYLSPLLVESLTKQIKERSAHKGIIITDHNYSKVIEVSTRLVLLRQGVLMELTDQKGLIEQGYLFNSHLKP